MTPEEIRATIQNTPMKLYSIAAVCGLHPSLLSKYLHNDREWPPNHLYRVSKYLTMIRDVTNQFRKETGDM